MPVETVQDIFDKTFPKRLQSKADLVTKINASYKFIVEGEGTWLVDLTKPGGVITKDSPQEATCTITIKAPHLIDLINGKLNPQMAFMTGKLKVAGDMGVALKLGALLG